MRDALKNLSIPHEGAQEGAELWVEAYQEFEEAWSTPWGQDWAHPTPAQGMEISIARDNPAGLMRALGMGADPAAPCGKEQNALAWAISCRAAQCAIILAARSDLSLPDKQGFSPLLGALNRGMAGLARELIKLGADPLARGANGDGALHAACRGAPVNKERGPWGSEQEREDCIALAAQVDGRWDLLNYNNASPLELLAERGAPLSQVAFAAPLGAKLVAMDAASALFDAVEGGWGDLARWMIQDGRFEYGFLDSNGDDSLTRAVERGDLRMVELLAQELGVKGLREHRWTHQRRRRDRDALDLAMRWQKWGCAQALTRAGWLDLDPDGGAKRARDAVEAGESERLQTLSLGMDLSSARGVDGESLLALAAAQGKAMVVEWLAAHDPASVDQVDALGRHPLELAAKAQNARAIRAILAALPEHERAGRARAAALAVLESGSGDGDETDWLSELSAHFDAGQARGSGGTTPLMLAAQSSAWGPVEFLSTRVEHSATDDLGRSALWHACRKGFDNHSHDRVMEILSGHPDGHGAINQGDGMTPLMIFAQYCRDEGSMRRFLPDLARLGDPQARSRSGLDAREILKCRNDACAELLAAYDEIAGAEIERREMMFIALPGSSSRARAL